MKRNAYPNAPVPVVMMRAGTVEVLEKSSEDLQSVAETAITVYLCKRYRLLVEVPLNQVQCVGPAGEDYAIERANY